MQNLIIDFIIFASLPGTLQSEGEGAAPIPHILFLTVTVNVSLKVMTYQYPPSSQFLHMYAIPMAKNSNLRFKHSSPFTYTLLKNNNACLYYYILHCQTFILIVWSIIAHFIKFSFIYTVYEMHLTISQIKMHNYPLLFLCILNSVFVAYYIIWM